MSPPAGIIWIGYAFRQELEFDAGAIGADIALRMDLRKTDFGSAILAELELDRVDANVFAIDLPAVVTALFPEGYVQGDLVARSDVAETPLGIRITIPVANTITKPKAF